MVQGRRGARLAAKALERDRICGGAGRQELDGDLPAKPQVFGAIDDAHAARAELGGHAIVRDRLANHRRAKETLERPLTNDSSPRSKTSEQFGATTTQSQ